MEWIVLIALAGAAYWYFRRHGSFPKMILGQEAFAADLNSLVVEGCERIGLDGDGNVDALTHRAIYRAIRKHLMQRHFRRGEYWDVAKTATSLIEKQSKGAVTRSGDQISKYSIIREVERIFGQVIKDFDAGQHRYETFD
jgi:hypothetical protein